MFPAQLQPTCTVSLTCAHGHCNTYTRLAGLVKLAIANEETNQQCCIIILDDCLFSCDFPTQPHLTVASTNTWTVNKMNPFTKVAA